ncbi:MAG TPA: PDZ domain-containing protein [Terracidiphilus sp.]|nr:PDZ domain-containing protein [Terracidiphilus sp.]
MKHFLRPYLGFGIVALLVVVVAPHGAAAQAVPMVELLQGASPLLLHTSSSQGYLGVDLADVDQEKAQALKLKVVRGAIITLIDHDAPAGQVGLKVNDVVLQLNGQNVEGAEQLRRMLREIPAGRKVSLEFSRDGIVQTISVELADRRAMEHEVWNKLGNDGDVFAQSPGMGVLAGGGDNALPGMFHMPIFGSTLNVGAMVEPLTGQMAEYLGVPNGLMVKQVAHKSEAASAGLKAFDVILKVGPDAVSTVSDWDRALRSNQGKQVQVTILRDKKQQTLTLQVDSKHRTGALEMEELFPDGSCPLVAELDTDAMKAFAQDSAAAKALRDQLKLDNFKLDQKQMDELKQQMEKFRKDFKVEDFKVEDFKIDQKQMDELKQQMEKFRKDFKAQDFEFAPN